VNTVTKTPIVWAYGSTSLPDIWIADSATTVHISSDRDDFSSYWKYHESHDIKAFGNNLVKGVGEGDIIAEVEFKGKVTKNLSHTSHAHTWSGRKDIEDWTRRVLRFTSWLVTYAS